MKMLKLKNIIKNIMKPVQGFWFLRLNKDTAEWFYECSVCGAEVHDVGTNVPYICPSCKAHMNEPDPCKDIRCGDCLDKNGDFIAYKPRQKYNEPPMVNMSLWEATK